MINKSITRRNLLRGLVGAAAGFYSLTATDDYVAADVIQTRSGPVAVDVYTSDDLIGVEVVPTPRGRVGVEVVPPRGRVGVEVIPTPRGRVGVEVVPTPRGVPIGPAPVPVPTPAPVPSRRLEGRLMYEGPNLMVLPNGDRLSSVYDRVARIGLGFRPNSFVIDGNNAVRVRNLEIGSFEHNTSYLFIDGFAPDDFNMPYISLDSVNLSVVMHTPRGKNSPTLRFLPCNRGAYGGLNLKRGQEFIIQALGADADRQTGRYFRAKSRIGVYPRESMVSVAVTEGPYTSVNGKRIVEWNPHHPDLPRKYEFWRLPAKNTRTGQMTKVDFRGKKAVPIQIHSLNSAGHNLVDERGNVFTGSTFVGKDGHIWTAYGPEVTRLAIELAK